MSLVSHAQNPNVLRRARDFYSVYCASSDGKNYQGLPCPEWDSLTDAVRGHWYTVALRSQQLEGERIGIDEREPPPSSYAIGHLPDPDHALEVWQRYSNGGAK